MSPMSTSGTPEAMPEGVVIAIAVALGVDAPAEVTGTMR